MTSISKTYEKRNELVKHRKDMTQLKTSHQNQREKAEIANSSILNEVKNAHKAELNSLNYKHEKDLLRRGNQSDKVLQKMEKSLAQTKSTIEGEKKRLNTIHNLKKENQRIQFESQFSDNQQKNQLAIQDQNHKAKTDMEVLQKRVSSKQKQLESVSRADYHLQKDMASQKSSQIRDQYYKDSITQKDKFIDLTMKQDKINKKEYAAHETKHQKIMSDKSKQFSKEVEVQEKVGVAKLATKRKQFQNHYNNEYSKQEIALQHLARNKEKIVHKLRAEIIDQHKVGVKKSNDPFYQMGKLNPSLEPDNTNKNYILSIPIEDHEANKVKVSAQGREIKIQMDRNFDFKQEEEGRVETMNKVESYITKMDTEKIVDPKSVTRDYKDGILTFKIKFA